LQSSDHFTPGSFVYTWGSNESGQLGYDTESKGAKANMEPNVVSDLEGKNIVQVSCGYSHTLALTADGGVFAWGCNKFGQLGHPNIGGSLNRPFAVAYFDTSSDDKKVIQISAGARFSAALTKGTNHRICFPSYDFIPFLSDGKVFCWGSNTHGELGRISKHSYKPREVTGLPSNIVSIHSGDQRCCATTSDGFCFLWGRLSSKDLLKDNHIPMLIDVFDGKEDVWVKSGACGRTHFAILEDGKLSQTLSRLKKEASGGFSNPTVVHEILANVGPSLLVHLQTRALNEVRRVLIRNKI
jgi:alpha-tubulin suppressor-like RCC1 family protein